MGTSSSTSGIVHEDNHHCDNNNNTRPVNRNNKCQGIFVAREIHDALEEMSAALTFRDIEHRLVLDAETEAHISIRRNALSDLAGLPDVDASFREIAILWGSTVHYVSDNESNAEARLSPAAQFRMASLQEERNTEVVVVPHWWWPHCASLEEKGGALLRLLFTETPA